ncbi:glycosyltransferase [Echinicola marina]|nr:glycosyltransferase [Echinicola marina]
MEKKLVSIICICYNQEDYILAALESVFKQSYEAFELIMVDNGSTDSSQEKIQVWLQENGLIEEVKTVFYPNSINYCKVFNQALELTKGEFVIDLSGDDVLYPEHLEASVMALQNSPQSALCSSNAVLYHEEKGKNNYFFPLSNKQVPADWEPKGDIYKEVVRNYCLCTPTMVFRSAILRQEGGYDDRLVYEDFDIIVRLARKYSFTFSPHIGVKKRIHSRAFAQQQYKVRKSEMLWSTYRVCQKIVQLNQSEVERGALVSRCKYEAKHALSSANFEVAKCLLQLADESGAKGFGFILLKAWAFLKLDLSFFYRLYAGS